MRPNNQSLRQMRQELFNRIKMLNEGVRILTSQAQKQKKPGGPGFGKVSAT